MDRRFCLGFIAMTFFCSACWLPITVFGYDRVQVVVKAPQKELFTKLPDSFSRAYGSSLRYNVNLSLEGWACDENIAKTVTVAIQWLNKTTLDLVKLQNAISASVKTLVEMEKKQQKPLDLAFKKTVIQKGIKDTLTALNYNEDRYLVETAIYEADRVIGMKKSELISYFVPNITSEGVLKSYYGSDAWERRIKLWKVDAEGYSSVYVLQDCYQKNDLDAMANAWIEAAKRLKTEADNYKEFKEAAQEWRLSFAPK
jgi:phage baseplate assembly protein W